MYVKRKRRYNIPITLLLLFCRSLKSQTFKIMSGRYCNVTCCNYLFLNIWALTRKVLNGSAESELFCWSRYLYIFVGSYTVGTSGAVSGAQQTGRSKANRSQQRKGTGGRRGQGGRQGRVAVGNGGSKEGGTGHGKVGNEGRR
jgi:hypothetical protein